ncbi:hypothetical protein [Hyphococcus lacteus]|uniref:Sulfotransferase n=1 Tax=Hyphococcus lacteus TaxID=3143536 RepID=A0ABV3Z6U5_9PROT
MTKNFVFIVSGGRTGTNFFGTTLGQVITDCFSVHEPDALVDPRKFGWKKTISQFQTFGVRHMIIDRVLKKSGIRNLAQQFLNGDYNDDNSILIQNIRAHREKYHASISESLIVESYFQWFGLLPVLRSVYPQAKVVGVIRDPRTWVQSRINYRGQHDKSDWIKLLGQSRLTPAMVNDHEYANEWNSMTVFQKLCWDWKITYELIESFAKADPLCSLYKFEDLFESGSTKERLDLFKFITEHGHKTYKYDLEADVFSTRHNTSKGNSNIWQNWSDEDIAFLKNLCGPIMEKHGYGLEPQWIERSNQSSSPMQIAV